MTNRRQFSLSTAAALFGLAGLGSTRAQGQLPLEQVKILYGFPAGSSGDICARRVGDKLGGSGYTKNPAVVENKPGAGGRIALELLKSAPADGSVLVLTPTSTIAVHPHIYSNLPYDPMKDFTPVGTASMMQLGLALSPLVPPSVKTVKDFLAWAKTNPKDASYGSPGAGSSGHFLGALLGINSNVDLKHAPYRGSAPGVIDVVGGQIAAMVTPHGDLIPHHKANKLRIIATSGKQRSPFVPEVPTFAEQGFADLTVEDWFGFYAPAKTPAHIVAAANAAINAALKDKAVIDSLALVGLIPLGGTPEEMERSARAEFARWGPLIKKIGFTAES